MPWLCVIALKNKRKLQNTDIHRRTRTVILVFDFNLTKKLFDSIARQFRHYTFWAADICAIERVIYLNSRV